MRKAGTRCHRPSPQVGASKSGVDLSAPPQLAKRTRAPEDRIVVMRWIAPVLALLAALVSPGRAQESGPSGIVDGLFSPEQQQRIERLSPGARREFTRLTLGIIHLAELDQPGSEQPTWRVHKWQRDVVLWVPTADLAPDDRQPLSDELHRLAEFVDRHHGPHLSITPDSSEANFWILFGNQHGPSESELRQAASTFFSGNLEAAKRFTAKAAQNNCAHSLNVVGPFGTPSDNAIVQAISFIRLDVPPEVQIGCMRRAFAFAMGFTRNAQGETNESWTQSAVALTRPTRLDGELLQLLYSARLSLGMEAESALRVMLDEALDLSEASPHQ